MMSFAFWGLTYFTNAVPLEVWVYLSTTTLAHLTFPNLAKTSLSVVSSTLVGMFLIKMVLDKSSSGSWPKGLFFYSFTSYCSFDSYTCSSLFSVFTFSSGLFSSSSSSLTLSAIKWLLAIEKSMTIGLPLNLLWLSSLMTF